MEDSEDIMAVQLTKDIVKVAAKALEKNLTLLAPLVLPYSELLKFAHVAALRMLGLRKGKAYQPDFKKAFQHFSLHAGKSRASSRYKVSSTSLHACRLIAINSGMLFACPGNA